MRSLRARVALLVGVLVTGSVLTLGLASQRAARMEYRASVSTRVVDGDPDVSDLGAAFDAGGWPAVGTALSGDPDSSAAFLAIGPDAGVLHAPDPAWFEAEVDRTADGFHLVRSNGPAREELRVAGGLVVASGADTIAWAFPLAGDDVLRAEPDELTVDVFTSGFARRLRLAGVLVVALAIGAALVLTGRVLAPLARLADAARKLGAGDLDTRVGSFGTRELDQVASAFDGMAESLGRAQEARRRMVRDVAHELRTPLTSLRGQVEALQDGLRPVDAAALAALDGEVRVLERLVGDLAEVARADAGALDLHIEPVELAGAVDGAVRGFVRAGRLPAERIEMAVPADLEVLADPVRLSQMLRNLVDNALVHGGDDVKIVIRAASAGDHAVLEVSDDGPGMSAPDAARAFDRLYRGDPARARPRDGTGGAGLGLSIVQELARAQGGDATLESRPGAGTRVRLTLPLA